MKIRKFHLQRRGKSYYFRMKVPSTLVELLKVTEVSRSIGTENSAHALSVTKLWGRKMKEIFIKAKRDDRDEIQIKRMFDDCMSAEFPRIRDICLDKEYADMKRKEEEADGIKDGNLKSFKNFNENGHLSVSTYVDKVYSFSNLPIPDKRNSKYLHICSRSFEYIYSLINDGSGITENLLSKCGAEHETGSAKATGGNTVKILYDEYKAEKARTHAWDDKTFRGHDGVFNLFHEVFGEDRDIRTYNHADMKKFRDEVLSKMPSNYTKYEKYKGKSYSQIIKLPGIKLLSVSTINGNLESMSSFFRWCIKHEYADKNPAGGLSLADNRRDDEKRRAYDSDDLQRILKSLPYHCYGPFKSWIPIIGMFSGMRQTEICQLHLEDVREIETVLCFDINANAEDKDVKSKAAVRTVPVHPALLEMGFADHLKYLKGKGVKRLWPELEYKRDGYGQAFQRWYGRFNRKYVTEDRLKCFHSMRHCFITNLKLKGVQDTEIMELVGHANPSMTTGRYGKRFPPGKLLEAMLKLDYGFDAASIVSEAKERA